MDETRYDVELSGRTIAGRKREQVIEDLMTLFSLDRQKAEHLLRGRATVIKKGLDRTRAEAYRFSLARAGVDCRLVGRPLQEGPEYAAPAPEMEKIICPRCGKEQPESDECVHCGIFIKKYMEREEPSSFVAPVPDHFEIVKDVRFFPSLPGVLGYPLKGRGLYLLIGGAIFLVIMKFLSGFFLLGLLAMVFMLGYISSYMLKVIRSTMKAEDEPPEWPDFGNFGSDVVIPFFLVIAATLVSFSPVVLYFFLREGPLISMSGTGDLIESLRFLRDPVFWLLVVFSCLYLPMALMSAAATGRVLSLNPLNVVTAAAKGGVDYLAACVLFFVLGFVSGQLQAAAGLIPYLGALVSGFVSLYFLLMEMRVIGLVYAANRERLGRFSLV